MALRGNQPTILSTPINTVDPKRLSVWPWVQERYIYVTSIRI